MRTSRSCLKQAASRGGWPCVAACTSTLSPRKHALLASTLPAGTDRQHPSRGCNPAPGSRTRAPRPQARWAVQRVRPSGRITVVCAAAGAGGAPASASASASALLPACLHGFVASLAKELGGRGVAVNLVVEQAGAPAGAAVAPTAFLQSVDAAFVSGQTLHAGCGGDTADGSRGAGPRLAVVTGAARGIGEAIVQRLVGDGLQVIAVDVPQVGWGVFVCVCVFVVVFCCVCVFGRGGGCWRPAEVAEGPGGHRLCAPCPLPISLHLARVHCYVHVHAFPCRRNQPWKRLCGAWALSACPLCWPTCATPPPPKLCGRRCASTGAAAAALVCELRCNPPPLSFSQRGTKATMGLSPPPPHPYACDCVLRRCCRLHVWGRRRRRMRVRVGWGAWCILPWSRRVWGGVGPDPLRLPQLTLTYWCTTPASRGIERWPK